MRAVDACSVFVLIVLAPSPRRHRHCSMVSRRFSEHSNVSMPVGVAYPMIGFWLYFTIFHAVHNSLRRRVCVCVCS